MKEHKKLEKLMLFTEVAESLSFTVAAEKLGISRGHLSAQIRRLEKDMGMMLLIRSTRNVKLTAEGERVLNGMSTIKTQLLALERSAELEGSAIEGMIKITAPRLFTDKFLLDICQQFKAIHPQITFSLNCSYTSYDLTKSNYDLAFRATNTPPQNMVAKQLLEYQQCCCASPQYLEKYGTPKSPQELVNHQCLSGPEQSTWPFVTAATDVSGWMEINDNTMLKTLAVNGEGIIRVAQYLVEQEIAQGKLIPILTNFENTASNIYIIHPQFIHQSKRLAAFIEFTKHYFKQRSTVN